MSELFSVSWAWTHPLMKIPGYAISSEILCTRCNFAVSMYERLELYTTVDHKGSFICQCKAPVISGMLFHVV